MKRCSSSGVVDTRYLLEVPRRDALNRRWGAPVLKNTQGLPISMSRSLDSDTQAMEH